MDYRQRLNALIDGFVTEKLPLERFQSEYTRCFIDDMPDSALTDTELEHYGAIHEKSEWASQDPDAESRQHGWLDAGEFRAWLRDRHRFASR